MNNPENRKFVTAVHLLNWYEVAKLMHENAHALHNSPQGLFTYKDALTSAT